MSVSHRVTGTWAELTADGSVAIPATPQAGDRMYLFARWKDFSITATVANWTELEEFTDGAVSSGNGVGSVKVACWYRDWQSGDANPTIDFSVSPTTASVVIKVMAKDADDVWLTPVARTAALGWTTSSQTTSASATVDVPSSSVVMGLVGLRDDSATMTRPTNGIDDSTSAITWNGNYVESPATHHSTTTGDDGAADLGYRLVTTGAAGVTLRMTGTISATETGAALWVVQGVSVQVTPGNASLTSSRFAPQLQLSITPATINLTTTQFAPQLREVITPPQAVLSLTGFAPTLTLSVTPPAATMTITSSAPQLREVITPNNTSLNITGFIPVLVEQLAPAPASLTLTVFAPSATQLILITVPNASLVLTTSPPHVLPFKPTWIDPGGDSVQAIGHFQTQVSGSGGIISFDPTQKVNGIGSYKFDSDDGDNPHVTVPSVMGATRRVSTYFRYDSVPDAFSTTNALPSGSSIYSGDGFAFPESMAADDGAYGTATPAKNSGQGSVFGTFGFASGMSGSIPNEAEIRTVKIIYEYKVDTDTSEAISRVKWVVDGVEGPDHDNIDEPLTDTVVEVDVTADRDFWVRDDLVDGVFEVIAEARRGDSDTEHTQSWDYVKVEVEYFIPFTILGPSGEGLAFEFALVPRGDGVILRLIDGDKVWYDGITELLPDTDHRISWGHLLHDTNLVDIKLYVDSIQELDIVDAKCAGGISNLVNLLHGWAITPGENKVCWFDQFWIDAGDDLTDCGNILSTHKGPATVNEDNWDTDGGNGLVDERPLNETNYKEHSTPIDAQYQTYNLQADDAGDIDISGESLVGHMGWAWAQWTLSPDLVRLVTNGVEVNRLAQLTSSPRLIRQPIASASYPTNARGIGMYVETEFGNLTLFECGVVVAYEGPSQDNSLFPFQELAENTLTPVIDDLRADLPNSYELRYQVDDKGAQVLIAVYSVASEGAALQLYDTSGSSGGNGQLIINAPGIEVNIFIMVVGGSTSVGLRRFLNPE